MLSSKTPFPDERNFLDLIADRVRNNDPTLTELRIIGNGRYGLDFKSLMRALAGNSSIVSVDLSSNGLRDEDAVVLGSALLKNVSVTELILSHNEISDAGTKALAEPLRRQKSSLVKLVLKFNRIFDEGARELAGALGGGNKSLAVLDLGRNGIGDEGARDLADALCVNRSLAVLNLPYNRIGDSGAERLGSALHRNASLAEIDLSHNRIGDNGAKAIAKALRPPSLTELFLWVRDHLQGNQGIVFVDRKGKAALEELQSNAALSCIFLHSRDIGKEGAVAFLEALRCNSTITKFWFNYDNSWDDIRTEIRRVLDANRNHKMKH